VVTTAASSSSQQEARKQEARKSQSRWPVTVAAILAGVALLLVAFVAARKHQNDVVSFSGSPSQVLIDSSAGLVVVVPADGNQVQVSRRAKWTLVKPDMDVTVQGGTLVVKADCIGPSFICDVEYRVSVPPDVAVRVVGGGGDVEIAGVGGKVDVQTSGGSVALGALTSDVKVRTTSGSVTLDSIAGALDVATDAGSINGTSLTSPVIQTGTSSGDITLYIKGAADRIGAGSGSGDITLVVPDLEYAVEAQAASPEDVVVGVNESGTSTRTISAQTGSGQISITRG
jgi:hypothetical protein